MTIESITNPGANCIPLGDLPIVASVELRGTRLLQGLTPRLAEALGWLAGPLGASVQLGALEISGRAAGLKRPGVIAQVALPARHARFGIGIETTLAHALVDRLLGFERLEGEDRLQVTPVEWGVLTLVVARTIHEFDRDAPRPRLVLDRVSLDPFQPAGLGPIVTLRWFARVGNREGSLRAWVPESLLSDDVFRFAELSTRDPINLVNFATMSGHWQASAGLISMPRGLGRLRVGSVLPIDPGGLHGTPRSPSGSVLLSIRLPDGRWAFDAEPVPESGGGRLSLSRPMHWEPLPREPRAVSLPSDPINPSGPAPTDLPVTLVVELGRLNLPVHRLADLKPGDVIELGRHAREPVELTSNGRLVARGELVQIDTELGVRIANVFL